MRESSGRGGEAVERNGVGAQRGWCQTNRETAAEGSDLGRPPRNSAAESSKPRGEAQLVGDTAQEASGTHPASLKRELERIDDFESWEAANLSIGEYIEGFYNPCRRHSALNYNSPIEFELIHSLKKAV